MTNEIPVLVVDDDFYIAQLHTRVVDQTPGFRLVGSVGTARGALSLIESSRPELVLLDTYLPDGSGIELIRHIAPDVIAVTAANEPETVKKALRYGVFSYLVKPFAPAVLQARLASYALHRAALDAALGAERLDQAAIDRLSGSWRSGTPTRTRATTEQAVLDAVRAAEGELSASQIAAVLGVSRATAQRYLGSLAAEKLIDVQLKYGSTGRPEHRYCAVR